MKLSEIIMTWHDLSEGKHIDQENIFFKFIAIWIAFNGIYEGRYDDKPDGPKKIKGFTEESEMISRHRELLESEKKYHEAIDYIQAKGVVELRTGDLYEIKDIRNLWHVMRCVYRIRNNLFHGWKAASNLKVESTNPRDEKLVDAAYTIVSQLLKPCFDPDWVDSWAEKESHSAYAAAKAEPAEAITKPPLE